MENIEMRVDGEKLVVTIDLKHRGGRSASGKTLRVASTGGNVDVPGAPNVKIGINAYVKE